MSPIALGHLPMLATRLKRLLLATVLILAALIIAVLWLQRGTADTRAGVGVIGKAFIDDARDRTLATYIWYPTQDTTPASLLDDGMVFHGFSAARAARPPANPLPLVILSHGAGGNRANQSWLAVSLARQGAIVIAANHPGSTSGDFTPATLIQAWRRPQDIQFLLDAVLADPELSPRIDASRIAVIGHSLGGYTALAVGGARLSREGFDHYCQQQVTAPDCLFYQYLSPEQRAVDQARFEGDYRDPRVGAVVALDPTYTAALVPADPTAATPALLIQPETQAVSGAAESLGEPVIRTVQIPNIHHFSFLPACKPLGQYVLQVLEPRGGPLCAPETGGDRHFHHQAILDTITGFLRAQGTLRGE